MDLAKTLIRSVARAFYDTRQVLCIDALLVHSALHANDFSYLMSTNPKELRKWCGKLKEDKMMTSHSRQETRETSSRPVNVEYFYIDFHTTIDAIKYRVVNLTKKVQTMYQPSEERKDFHCPRCKANWTQIEVLDKVGPEGFECHRCSALLERDDRAAGEATGHEKHSKLMSQLEKLLKLLRQIDEAEIPKNDFEAAFAVAVPIARDDSINPHQATVPVNGAKARPATVKGVTQAAAPLGISLTTASEKTAVEQEAEAKRKAALAAQNQLPEWISTSTVTGDISAVGMQQRERQLNESQLGVGKTEEDDKIDAAAINDELNIFYEIKQREEEAEKAKALEDEDSDDEAQGDDEEDFEDVAVGAATPSSSTSANVNGPRNGLLNGLSKSQGSESGSSAPGTGISTPAGSQSLPVESNGPPAKRLKVGGHGNGDEDVEIISPAKDSDEDDEAEFEDAL